MLMAGESLRILVLGAHPDDAEFHAGGLMLRYLAAGHYVKVVSVTDGSAGHHRLDREQLIAARRAEADAVRNLIGIEYDIWGFPDGQLQPTLEVRHRIIQEIRRFQPDLVLTHRPCDYHPDHRAVGLAVQDASYMVTVPLIAPDTPALRRDPVVAYMVDLFVRPYPFCADIVLDAGPQFPGIIGMLDCHACQVYEWLPYNLGILDQVPDDAQQRRVFLSHWFGARLRTIADRFRDALVRDYGPVRGKSIEMAEAYEISEYARPLDAESRARLFPFVS
jgi:LmbE family N-acetylglucosaminyl deacetylase